MTAPAAPPPDIPLKFSEILTGLGRAPTPRVTVRDVLDVFGEQGLGAVMLIFALFSCLPLPPGGSTITGAPLLILSVELATVRRTIWLPRKMINASLSRETLRHAFGWMIPVVRVGENLTRPRLAFLTGRLGQGLIGTVCFLLSIVLVLPIPLGNMAPAATIALFSLGVMQRDGFAVILGWVGVGVSVGLLTLVWRVVWQMAQHLIERVSDLNLSFG